MILKLDPGELLPIRVQYLADTDPYNSMAMYPIPSRAPTYSFVCSTPLATQLGAILRLLGAPQRVSINSYNNFSLPNDFLVFRNSKIGRRLCKRRYLEYVVRLGPSHLIYTQKTRLTIRYSNTIINKVFIYKSVAHRKHLNMKLCKFSYLKLHTLYCYSKSVICLFCKRFVADSLGLWSVHIVRW